MPRCQISQCHTALQGRGNPLEALDSVTLFLTDALFSRTNDSHRERDSCSGAGQVCSGSLFHIALQSQEHPLILLVKPGDDEGLCHFEQAMDVKSEIAVHACHLFHRLKGMAKMDVYGPGQQTLLHLHGLMEADTRRRIILRDLAVPRASRSSINIGGPKTDRQRRDLRDRTKRL